MPKTKQKLSLFDRATQIFLPVLTLLGYLLTGLKHPAQGLLFSFAAQVFWLYAGWKAWKQAGQIGLFVTAVGLTFVLAYGILNYFVL